MASMHFIIENDVPMALAVQGDLMDIVGCITYLIGKVYSPLCEQNPAAASALQKMLTQAVSDPDSPVWNIKPNEGETTIFTQVPKNSGGEKGERHEP